MVTRSSPRVAVVGLVVSVALLAAGPAAAGGSWLTPVRDRYEAGDEATLVGYVGPGQLGWTDDGPFYAHLRVDPAAQADAPQDRWPWIHDTDVPLGPMELEDRGALGYLSLRISVTFTVPADLPPGAYEVTYCNDPCTTGIGDLIGGMVHVGVDPPHPVVRNWALTDPEIANLDDAALLAGPGTEVTAAEVRAGTVAHTADGAPIVAPPTGVAAEPGPGSPLQAGNRVTESPPAGKLVLRGGDQVERPLGGDPTAPTGVAFALGVGALAAVGVVVRRRRQ